jgi:hypothetical protein
MYKTQEYQRRLTLRAGARRFMTVIISVNDLTDIQLEQLNKWDKVFDFIQDLGFYCETQIPTEWKKIFDFSKLFYTEVERYTTVNKLVIDTNIQTNILGGMISLQKFVEIQSPVLNKLERERCIKQAFDYRMK